MRSLQMVLGVCIFILAVGECEGMMYFKNDYKAGLTLYVGDSISWYDYKAGLTIN